MGRRLADRAKSSLLHSIAFAIDKMIATLNSLLDGHLILVPLYLEWDFFFQLYDSFLYFYYSSLPFKLSNKTALMKYSTDTHSGFGKGRLINHELHAMGFLNGFAKNIVGNIQDSKYKICAKIIQFLL